MCNGYDIDYLKINSAIDPASNTSKELAALTTDVGGREESPKGNTSVFRSACQWHIASALSILGQTP